MPIYLTTLDLNADIETVVSSVVKTEVYNAADNTIVGVPGGTLPDEKSIRITLQGMVSFATVTAELTVYIKYGAACEALATFGISGGEPVVDAAFVVEALLSGMNGPNLQKMHMFGVVGVPVEDWIGIPTGSAGGTEDASDDQDLKIYFQWNESAAGNEAVKEHVIVEIIADPIEVDVGDSAAPLTQIVALSLLNKLPESLYKDVTFYGEFLHHLDYTGIGEAAVARAAAANATWRDGSAHSVAANRPRFEYSADVAQGLLINSGVSETLTIPNTNALESANTLFWKENGVIKYTTLNTNPFNGSGVWTGTNNIHISHVLKFNRVLSAAEIATVVIEMTRYVA